MSSPATITSGCSPGGRTPTRAVTSPRIMRDVGPVAMPSGGSPAELSTPVTEVATRAIWPCSHSPASTLTSAVSS